VNKPAPTILMIDDDIVDVKALRRGLIHAQFDVRLVEAQGGVEALERLDSGEFNGESLIVLLDLNMPRMNGIEVLQALQQKALRPVVWVMTTSSAEEDIRQAYQAGAAGYFVKSELGDDFIGMIRVLEAYLRRNQFCRLP